MKLLLLLGQLLVVCYTLSFSLGTVYAKESFKKTSIDYPVRAFHFALRHLSFQEGKDLIDRLKLSGFNTVQVLLTTGVKFQFSPWTSDANAWSSNEFKAWVEYARLNGIEIIPELKLLTHQEKHFFQGNSPSLMYEKDTYDPSNSEVYRRVFKLLDEVIELIHPKAIHIGHDELVGWKKTTGLKSFFTNQKKILPASLFLKDVMKLHDYLAQRGVTTWMWGDMLISTSEAPEMNILYLHGGMEGYGASLRDKIPKDIVIVDWHYRDVGAGFSSLKVFRDDGFLVIGATWKNDKNIRDFSYYGKEHGAYGMMATSWYYLNGKRIELVNHIIELSGQTFLKDFPDEK